MPYYTSAQTAAMNRDARNMNAAGIALPGELENIRELIAAGSVGITAAAEEVDSVAKGGGQFSLDTDLITGLTLAWKASRFHNGMSNVAVSSGTLTMSPSTTNYVEVSRTGTVSSNTSGFTSGRMPLWTVATGVSSIATITSAKPLLTLIGTAGVSGTMLSTPAKTKSINVNLGDIAATTSFCIILPNVAGTIARVNFATKTAISTSNSDYWTFAAKNKGASGAGTTDILDTADVNTTKTTGGSSISAYIKRALALHGTAGNLETAAEDVLEVTVTKSGSATTMQQCSLRIDIPFES